MGALFKPVGTTDVGLVIYTWEDNWFGRISNFAKEMSGLNAELKNVSPGEPYGFSYVIDRTCLSDQLSLMVSEIADGFLELNPTNGIMLFDGLLPNVDINTKVIQSLFSLLSCEFNKRRRTFDPMSFHSPIIEFELDEGFPVHADLFQARALFNVITRSDEFCGGDILLISRNSFVRAMDQTDKMPLAVKKYIEEVLVTRRSTDSFDFVFDLIHGDHEWHSDLKEAILSKQICMPSTYGSGYFVVDGEWLHGRSKIQGPVSGARLQRLIFDTNRTKALNLSDSNFKEKIFSMDDGVTLNLKKSAFNKAILNKGQCLGRNRVLSLAA